MPRRLFSADAEQAGRRSPTARGATGSPTSTAPRRRRGRRGRTTPSVPPSTPRCARGGTWRSSAGRPARRGSCCTRPGRRTASGTPSSREQWRARAAGWLTDYVAGLDPTDEPVGNERTVGATTERLRCRGASTGSTSAATSWWSSTTRPAGCRPPTTRPAAHPRWPPTCSGSGARCAVPAHGSSSTTCPAAPSRRSSTPNGRWPTTCAGPRTSPRTSPPRPSAWPPAPSRRGVPRRPGPAVRLVRLPAELPDRSGGDARAGDVELPGRGRAEA